MRWSSGGRRAAAERVGPAGVVLGDSMSAWEGGAREVQLALSMAHRRTTV